MNMFTLSLNKQGCSKKFILSVVKGQFIFSQENMDDLLYEQVRQYLLKQKIPKNLKTSKSNWLATARKYEINNKGCLIRNRKIVVKVSLQEKIFEEMHRHSGRISCWERIKKR